MPLGDLLQLHVAVIDHVKFLGCRLDSVQKNITVKTRRADDLKYEWILAENLAREFVKQKSSTRKNNTRNLHITQKAVP
jgi:hypothetical protein